MTSAEGAELWSWLEAFVGWWLVCLSEGLPIPTHGSMWGHAMLWALHCYKPHWALWDLPGRPSEATQTSQSNFFGWRWQQLCFWAFLSERVEALGSHGHLSLVNHPWSSRSSGFRSPGSLCFVAAGSLACGSQSQATRPHLPHCRLGLLWKGRMWRSWSVKAFGHECWKMWFMGIPVLSLLEITGSTYRSAWLAESLKKQGGTLEIKQTFYNQEHILCPAQPAQVSHPFRWKGVAGA